MLFRSSRWLFCPPLPQDPPVPVLTDFPNPNFQEAGLPNRFPRRRSGKESACQCRRHKRCRFDPWVRKIPWSRKWQPTSAFLLENSTDRGAWWATVHGSAKSQHDSTSKHSTAAMCWIVTNIKEKTKLEEEACVYGCGFQTECLGSPISKKMAFEGKSE